HLLKKTVLMEAIHLGLMGCPWMKVRISLKVAEMVLIPKGNGPGPADFLNGVNGSRTPYLPPPIARSPTKSGMTGSPRRTPGLRSSQSPHRDLPSSSPSDGRSVKADSRRDVSPLTSRSINATPSLNHSNVARAKGNKKVEKAPPISL